MIDLAAVRKRDKPLTHQILADTWQSTQMISSMCERRANTCPLPST